MKITDEMKQNMDDMIAQHASSGSVDKKKVGMMFRAVGLNPTQTQVAEWHKECGGSDVAADKFKAVATKKLQECGDSQDEIIDAFSVFDKDGTGMIPVAEFRHICLNMGEALSEKEMSEVMSELEVGSDGMLNYRQFAEQIYSL